MFKGGVGGQGRYVSPSYDLVAAWFATGDGSATGWEKVSALGDIGFCVAYRVTQKGGYLLALGMVGTARTATKSEVDGKQPRLGLEALLAAQAATGVQRPRGATRRAQAALDGRPQRHAGRAESSSRLG